MSELIRRDIPVAITFVVGIIVLVDYFVSNATLRETSSLLTGWGVVLSAFAVGIGTVSIVRRNLSLIQRRDAGYWYNIVLLATLAVMTFIGVFYTINHPVYDFVYFNVFTPLSVTVFGMLAFYITGAAYRAFKFRGVDSAIMLICAILVMLRNAPIGAAIWAGFPTVGNWLFDVPNVAAQRGIIISVAIGIIVLGVRVLLGYERGYLGGRD